ncbi:MAG: ferredoxin, partial [Myxococcales bacterium]|nr:ferredoxin [Myxococcales bacterium]
MADATRRLPTNVEGDLFVDETCIDCGACRWMLPTVFDAEDGASRVYRQPDARERARALQAAVACPSGSIGTARRDPEGLRRASSSFPHPMAEGVFHCGYHSEKSFGAASYL